MKRIVPLTDRLCLKILALFSVRRVQAVESSGGQRLQQGQGETRHPDENSAAATHQRSAGLHGKTAGRDTHTPSSLTIKCKQGAHPYCRREANENFGCFRCLFPSGPAKCISSNSLRTSRLCTTWCSLSPGERPTNDEIMFPFMCY